MTFHPPLINGHLVEFFPTTGAALDPFADRATFSLISFHSIVTSKELQVNLTATYCGIFQVKDLIFPKEGSIDEAQDRSGHP